jgi:RNA recognition motif-containing protein
MTEEQLEELFSHFGDVESDKKSRNDGTSTKFGFVCFTDVASAHRVIKESILLKVKDKNIYVSELVRSKARKMVNLTRINQCNNRQRHIDSYLGAGSRLAPRPPVTDGIVSYHLQYREMVTIPAEFPAPGQYPGFSSPEEMAKALMFERFRPGAQKPKF